MSPETVALWHFDEKEDYMRPADVLGNVSHLVPAVTNRPAIVAATFGLGRQMVAASSRAYKGTCDTTAARRALRLTRSFTVDVVLRLNSDPGAAETIFSRGLTGSAGERQVICVQLIRSTGTFRFRWEEKGGTLRTADLSGVQIPSGPLYLVWAREWRADDDCDVLAYVNGELVGKATSTTADIDDGDTGEVNVGCRYNGAAYTEFLNGEIDELRVAAGARSAEEIKHTYRTLFAYPAWGYELIQQSSPPGTSYSGRPESKAQRTQMVEGDAMGLAWAKLDELFDYHQPDVAWSVLDHWELITRLAPLPTDSIETRRERVLAHLRKIHGYHRDSIKDAVYALMKFPDAASVVLIEHTNMHVDDLSTITSTAWTRQARAGTITDGGSDTVLAAQTGDDARWDATHDLAVRQLVPLGATAGVELIVALAAVLDDGSQAGLFVGSSVDSHLFGIRNHGGTQKFFHRRIDSSGATSVIGIDVPAATRTYLRMRLRSNGTFDLSYRTNGTGYEGPWTDVFTGVATIATMQIGGIFLACDTAPCVSASQTGTFRDWRVWCPASLGVYNWQVYADPMSIPDPDIAGAQVVIDRMKPAHTRGTAVQSIAFLTDDPYSVTDETPLGS